MLLNPDQYGILLSVACSPYAPQPKAEIRERLMLAFNAQNNRCFRTFWFVLTDMATNASTATASPIQRPLPNQQLQTTMLGFLLFA